MSTTSEKSTKTTPETNTAKTTKSETPETAKSNQTTNQDTVFAIAYDRNTRVIRIGNLTIPIWMLTFAAGFLTWLVLDLLINHR